MAHLWLRLDSSEWGVLELAGEAYDLLASPPRRIASECPPRGPADGALVVRASGAAEESWLLLLGRGRRGTVNGVPVVGGARRLADRDAIRLDRGPELYFSTERLAAIEAHPADERPLFCPRCKQAIVLASPSVRCPRCRIWHHQSEELPCWTYAPTCALCPQPSELDAGFRWTPEEL